MRRFFFNADNIRLSQYSVNEDFELTEKIYHHWCRVLRAKIDDTAYLFDGFGGEYQVQIQEINKKTAIVKLIGHDHRNNDNEYKTSIGLVMSKGDRMDYAIQKSTELGVNYIQLLTSQHGEVRLKQSQLQKKLQHWQQIAISASEQCGLNRPPLIFAPIDINQYVLEPINCMSNDGLCENMVKLYQDPYYCLENIEHHLSLILSVPKNVENHQQTQKQIIDLFSKQKSAFMFNLLIGPEGGFNDEEHKKAEDNNWLAWQIGNRILRTETAPVVALSALNVLNNG